MVILLFVGFCVLSSALVSCDFSCGPYVAIDLTYTVNDETIYWMGRFNSRPLERQVDPYYLASNFFSNPEHGGTHLDAPFHFNRDGRKVGDIPLRDFLMVEGVIIDVSHKTVMYPEYRLTPRDIRDWERRHGPLPDHCLVMINFGWAHKYTNRTAYLGIRSSDDFDRHFPGIGADAARYLLATRKVVGVGVDTASLDANTDVVSHILLLGANLYGIENLALDRVTGVPPRGFKVIVLPMRLEEGTGAPVNVVVMVDTQDYRPVAPPGKILPLRPVIDFTVRTKP